MKKHRSTARLKAIYPMLVIASMLNCQTGSAAVTLHTDLASWQSAFSGSTSFLETNPTGAALANEVASAPGNNDVLGNVLTFESSNTGFGFDFTVSVTQVGVTGDGFTFNDTEGVGVWQTGVLSVGDIDNAQDDGFEVSSSTALYGFHLDFIGNEFSAGESLTLFDGAAVVASFTTSGDIPDDPGTPERTFWGVTSSTPFDRILFDEDPDGDDLGIADFGFSTIAPIPEPSSFALIIASMVFMYSLRRRKK
jgi:hypothetical protein